MSVEPSPQEWLDSAAAVGDRQLRHLRSSMRLVATSCSERLNMIRVVLSVAGLLVLAPCLSAQSLRDPEFMRRVQPAFDDIFNLDYHDAEQIFVALRQEYPQHPAPPLYLAAIIWLRQLGRQRELDLDRFVSPGYFRKAKESIPAAQRKPFIDYMDQSEALSKAILANSPADKDALYFLASAYGIRGSFVFTIEHNLRAAFNHGKRAYQIDRRLVQQDPQYYDAYMTVGIYEYIVGSMPWYLKWLLSIFGFQGSKERGFQYLDTAVGRGQYVSREARVVRSVLLVREGRYADALKQMEALRDEFPKNYLFHLNVGQILETMGKRDGALAVYLDVLNRAEGKTVNYGELPLGTFRYEMGRKFMELGRRDLAEEQFLKGIKDPRTPDREKALSHLHLGQILDSQGKRSQAIQQYQSVLKAPEFENSHSSAREFLKKPYRS